MDKRKKKEDKPCRQLSESAKENLAGLIIRLDVPPQPWKVFQAAGLHKLIRFEQEEPAAAGEEDVHK